MIKVKSCSKCIHKVAKTKKEIKTMNEGKPPSPTTDIFDTGNEPVDYKMFKCDKKHDLKFGIVRCQDFKKIKYD